MKKGSGEFMEKTILNDRNDKCVGCKYNGIYMCTSVKECKEQSEYTERTQKKGKDKNGAI